MEPVPEDMKVSTLVPKDPGVLRLVGPGGRGSDALERRVPRRPAISDAAEVSEVLEQSLVLAADSATERDAAHAEAAGVQQLMAEQGAIAYASAQVLS